MSMMKDFKEFAIKGNVIDLAVGIIIGAAFKSIISSFVQDVVMPPIGLLLGGVDFSQLYINLSETTYASLAEATKAAAPVMKYGAFIQAVVDFVIIAFVVFLMVRMISKMQKKQEEAPSEPAPTPEDIVLLREIRNALQK